MKQLLSLLLVLGASLFLASSANAMKVGIGDQSPATFSDARFQELNTSVTRYIVRWDIALRPEVEQQRFSDWLREAQAHNLRTLVSLSDNGSGKRPSTTSYKRAVAALFAKYPIQDFGVWNEANHKTQATYKSPKQAALYAKAARSYCYPAKGCKLVAIDVLDQPDLFTWTKTFQKYYPYKDSVCGLHNYREANARKGASGMSAKFSKLCKGKVWYTETGGILSVPKRNSKGVIIGSVKYPMSTANKAVKNVFSLAKKNKVERVYFYNWYSHSNNLWDSAFLANDGSARTSLFKTFRSYKF